MTDSDDLVRRYCVEHNFRGPPITGAHGLASLRCSKCGMSQAWFRVRSAFAPSARDEMNEIKSRIEQLERDIRQYEDIYEKQAHKYSEKAIECSECKAEADTLAMALMDVLDLVNREFVERHHQDAVEIAERRTKEK